MKSSMRVKFLKVFRNPVNNRRTEIGKELNVPINIFWLNRIKEKDCEKIKLKKKSAPTGAQVTQKKQGSK